MSMNTYSGKPTPDPSHLDTREWMFGLLASDRYRARAEQLAGLDVRRRPDCEPCLQALVTDKWTPETEHHLGWCDSCRSAAAALGAGPGFAAPSPPRRGRRALLVALAAGVAIAAPLGFSRLLDDPLGQRADRGGLAHVVPQKPIPRSKPTTKPTTQPTTKPTTKPTGTASAVKHQRGGLSAADQRALPHTT